MQSSNQPYLSMGHGHQYIAPALSMHTPSSANHPPGGSSQRLQFQGTIAMSVGQVPAMTMPAHSDTSGRSKRKQVKNACVNCQKACKKCDDGRACQRCIKLGLAATCVDSPRKERRKGVKRGPYKKRPKQSEDEWDETDYSKQSWPDRASQKTSTRVATAPQVPTWEQPPPPTSSIPSLPTGLSFSYQGVPSVEEHPMAGYRQMLSGMASPPLSSASDQSDTYAPSTTTSLSSSPTTYFQPTINYASLEARPTHHASAMRSDSYSAPMLVHSNSGSTAAATFPAVYHHHVHSPTAYPSPFPTSYEPELSQPIYHAASYQHHPLPAQSDSKHGHPWLERSLPPHSAHLPQGAIWQSLVSENTHPIV